MHESRGYRQRLARFQVNSIEHERCQDRGVPGEVLVELDGGASELSQGCVLSYVVDGS